MATNNNNDNGRQSQGLDINSNEVISDFDYQKDQGMSYNIVYEKSNNLTLNQSPIDHDCPMKVTGV